MSVDPPDMADAERLVTRVNALSGYALELVGVASEGVSGGAVYVRQPDGQARVITCSDPPIEQVRLTTEVLELATASGLPVPRQEFVGELDDGRIVVVQERLPGNPIRKVDVPLIEALVAVNDRFADLLANRPDVPEPVLAHRGDHPYHPGPEALDGYDDRTRARLARIQAIASSVPTELPGDDLVHPDFARGNVLVDRAGQITGLVDWSTALRGNRAYALVSLRSDLEWRVFHDRSEWAPQSAVDRLDEILRETIEPTTLLTCWAHWTLHKVYCAIAENEPKQLDMWLGLGERWLLR